jgi:hypothetical protein
MKTMKVISIISVVVLVTMGLLTACSDSDSSFNPVSSSGDAALLGNYSQMNDGSTVVKIGGQEYQVNMAVSNGGKVEYNNWMYVEINQQKGAGLDPGVNQVPVQVQNVQVAFTGLSADVTDIVAAVKDPCGDYTEIGSYAVADGNVTIPVAYQDLVTTYGPTHFSVWFKAVGGTNKQGVDCGSSLTVSGTMKGQPVSLTKGGVCLDTEAPPQPVTTATVAPAAAWCEPPANLYGFNWYYARGGESCASACAACGTSVNPAGLAYFVGNADAANECAALIPAVFPGTSAGGSIDNNPPTATYGTGGPNGCHDYTDDSPAGIIWVSDTNAQDPNWVINAGEGMFCPCL